MIKISIKYLLRFNRSTTNLLRDNIFCRGNGVPQVCYNNIREEDIILEDNLTLQDSDSDNRVILE